MTGVSFKDAAIGDFSRVVLRGTLSRCPEDGRSGETGTYILLLLVDVSNLEPNILFSQWPRWVFDDPFEALKSCQ